MKLITNPKELRAAITAESRSSKAQDKRIHMLACSVIVHAVKHGDVTLADKLCNALPKLGRKNALRNWFLQYGVVFKWNTETKTFNKKESVALIPDYDISENEGVNNPFYESQAHEGGEYRPFDYAKAIMSLVKRAEKALEKEEVTEEQVNAIKALVA